MLGMFTNLIGNSVSCCPYAHEKSFENQNRGIKYISCKKFVVQRLRNHDEQAEINCFQQYLLPFQTAKTQERTMTVSRRCEGRYAKERS